METRFLCRLAVLSLFLAASSFGQQSAAQTQIPVATQTLLNGVKSAESKSVIKSVLMLVCTKNHTKGTGFAIGDGGVVVTNSHVVGACNAEEMLGIPSVGAERVRFTHLENDQDRDLALLCATKPLPSRLQLSKISTADVETEVETWGYPLRYEGPAPILSRGYVAGYTIKPGTSVKHLIVNGALNPGNSGGPLIERSSGRVVGVVVEKWRLFSPNIEAAIKGLSPQNGGATLSGGIPIYVTDDSGHTRQVMQQEATSIALKEIYDKSQVMIGEAIEVSELNAFINEKRQILASACSSAAHSTEATH